MRDSRVQSSSASDTGCRVMALVVLAFACAAGPHALGPINLRTSTNADASESQSFRDRVDAAITKGSAFLEGWIIGDEGLGDGRRANPRFDEVVLVALAILHAHDGGDFPLGPRLDAYISKWWRSAPSTYGVSLSLLYRCACADQLQRGRDERWKQSYLEQRGSPSSRREMQGMCDWLLSCRSKLGLWGYIPGERGMSGDVSNSQFAMLALLAASRQKLAVSADFLPILVPAIEATLGKPEAPIDSLSVRLSSSSSSSLQPTLPLAGTHPTPFRYAPANARGDGGALSTTLGATVVALAGLALVDGSRRGEIDTTLGDGLARHARVGLAWIAAHFTVRANPSFFERASASGPRGAPSTGSMWELDPQCQLYTMYTLLSLERCMELAGIELVNGKDWYTLGAERLLQLQEGDGSWLTTLGGMSSYKPVGAPRPLDTAMAVLFLRRASQMLVRSGPVKAWYPVQPTTPSR